MKRVGFSIKSSRQISQQNAYLVPRQVVRTATLSRRSSRPQTGSVSRSAPSRRCRRTSAPDVAFAGGTSATVLGNLDIASVLATGSTATAGADATTPGDFDLAAVFGDLAHATLTGVSGMVDIVP